MDATQKILLAATALILLYHSYRGWRLGPVRQLISIIALGAACADGYFFSAATVRFLKPLGMPNLVLELLGGAILTLLTYIVIITFAGILFKKTSDQKNALVWFVYGATGSLIGIAFGLAIVLALAIGIRLLGTLAGGIAPKSAEVAPSDPPVQNTDWQPRWPGTAPVVQPPATKAPPLNAVASTLVDMKQTLDKGVVGEVLCTVDPVPKGIYDSAGKIGRLSARPEAIAKFLSYPGAQELALDPAIIGLKDDPEVARNLLTHNYAGLLTNERVVKVFNDPRLAAKVKKFDFSKALDYALLQ